MCKNLVKVVRVENSGENVNDDELIFDNGYSLSSQHLKDRCENHFWSLADLAIRDFEGLEFNLDSDGFLERSDGSFERSDGFFERIEGYGIALLPVVGHPVRIPAYGINTGYYSDELLLVLKDGKGEVVKEYDISLCQDLYGIRRGRWD